MAGRIAFGIDNFLLRATGKEKRYALVTNNAAVTSQGISSRVALLKNGFTITKLFSPEHGLTASGEDGASQKNSVDPVTGLPVISLYGDNIAPAEKDLSDIDIILFDLPDVGCRFYTYLWTMTYVMQSCEAFNKPLIILDRPNPIGGNMLQAEGPMLDEAHCSSFIGRWNIPIRHSCTLGELAMYFAATKIKQPDIEIVKVTNWQRHRAGKDWFTPTSPAIQNITTALVYPGMGLLEGINVNEGRGAGKPFTICGAPWMNSSDLANAFTKKNCEGISCTPYSYIPAEGLYAGRLCNGLEFFITNEAVRTVAAGITLLQTIAELYPDHIKERRYATKANPTGAAHLDKLMGIQYAFNKIKRGEEISTAAEDWKDMVGNFLLY